MQPVVRQAADHGPYAGGRISRLGVQRQDAVHLRHIDPPVRPARHGVRHRQAPRQPPPARRPVRRERQPPDCAPPGLPAAQIRDQPVAVGQSQQPARHPRPLAARALPDQAHAHSGRHDDAGGGPPAAVPADRIGPRRLTSLDAASRRDHVRRHPADHDDGEKIQCPDKNGPSPRTSMSDLSRLAVQSPTTSGAPKPFPHQC
ncbi:hypothetical protein D3C87_1478260 [compost metagenome]